MYESDELREPIDGEELKVEIYDGLCDISKDYISDNWDGVTISADFGCKFFEQKKELWKDTCCLFLMHTMS